MTTCCYPKGGKKPGTNGQAADRQERTGEPYRFRPTMGDSEDEQYRRRTNDYSKTAKAVDAPVREGMMVSPRRTMISG